MNQIQQQPFDLPYKKNLLDQQVTRLINENNSIRMQLWTAKQQHEKIKIKLLTKMGHTYQNLQNDTKLSQTVELMKVKLLNRQQQIVRLQKIVEENHNYIYHRQIIVKYEDIIKIMQQQIKYLTKNAKNQNNFQSQSNSTLRKNLKKTSSAKIVIPKSSKMISLSKNSEDIMQNQKKQERQDFYGKINKKSKHKQKDEGSHLKLQQFEKTIQKINKKMQKNQNKLSILQKQNNELKQKNKQLQSKLYRIEKQNDKSKAVDINFDHNKDLTELKKQLKKVKKDEDFLSNQNKILRSKLIQMQDIISRQQKQMKRFQNYIVLKQRQIQIDKKVEQFSIKQQINV